MDRSTPPLQLKNLWQVTRHLFLVGFWLLVVLLLVEFTLRLLVSTPLSHTYDPQWGWQPAAGTTLIRGTEGYGYTYYISAGENATPYNTGPNIVVLGDSHTAAHQVHYTDTFPSVAETQLVTNGRQLNLRNLGYAGASIADYVYLAPLVKERFDPGLVVIQLSTSDFVHSEIFATDRPNYFQLNAADQLELVHPPTSTDDANRGFITSILLAHGLRRKQLLFDQPQQQTPPSAPGESDSSKIAHEFMDDQLELLRQAYADVPVIIVMLPYTPAIVNNQLVLHNDEYDAVLQELQQIEEWSIVDPRNSFQTLLHEGKLPRGFSNSLPSNGHLNRHGHRIVGRKLATEIQTTLFETK